jgi:hypothetical protein
MPCARATSDGEIQHPSLLGQCNLAFMPEEAKAQKKPRVLQWNVGL